LPRDLDVWRGSYFPSHTLVSRPPYRAGMKTKPKSRRKKTAVVKLLSALDRMILAAKQAEKAREELLSQSSTESGERREVARA